MRPRVHSVAAQGLDVDLLAGVQVVQGLGEEMDGVVHQGGFGLKSGVIGFVLNRDRCLQQRGVF